jgi:hypothetical protein
MIHLMQMQTLQIRNFAGNMKREDLPPQATFLRTLALGYNGSPAFPVANRNRERTEGGNIGWIELRDGTEPPQHACQYRFPIHGRTSFDE